MTVPEAPSFRAWRRSPCATPLCVRSGDLTPLAANIFKIILDKFQNSAKMAKICQAGIKNATDENSATTQNSARIEANIANRMFGFRKISGPRHSVGDFFYAEIRTGQPLH
jgi:hypothetical protein